MKIHENSWKFTDINGSNNYAGRSLSWLFLVSIRLIYVTCLSLLHSTAYTVIMHPHVAWYAIVVQGQIFSQTGHKHFWEFMKIYGCLHDKPGTHVDPPKDVSVLSYGMSQCCSKPPQTQKKTHTAPICKLTWCRCHEFQTNQMVLRWTSHIARTNMWHKPWINHRKVACWNSGAICWRWNCCTTFDMSRMQCFGLSISHVSAAHWNVDMTNLDMYDRITQERHERSWNSKGNCSTVSMPWSASALRVLYINCHLQKHSWKRNL